MVRAFLTMITKKMTQQKIDKGTEIAIEFEKKIAKLEKFKFTLPWVRPRLNLMNVEYDPWNIHFTVTWKIIDTSTFKNCLSLSQPWFPEKNYSVDLIPGDIKYSFFLSVLYSKPPQEHRKPKFKNGDRVRFSRFDLHFRKGCETQFAEEVFEIGANFSRKPPTCTKKMKRMRLSAVNLIRKRWSKSFNNEIVYNSVDIK